MQQKLTPMKNIFTFTLLLIVTFSKAQTLEFSTPVIYGNYNNSIVSLYLVKLTAGDKIVKLQQNASSGSDSAIILYNPDYSIYKSFTIPQISGSTSIVVNHISDNLFNSDSKVEFGFTNTWGNAGTYDSDYFVYTEDGTKIFERDSILQDYGYPVHLLTIDGTKDQANYGANYFNTSSGWKFYLQTSKNNEIYSLPGTQPLTALAKPVKDVPFNFSNPYPNPTSGMAKIDFTLPVNTAQGEILVYTQQGELLKTFTVDNTFGTLLINNSNVPAGVYYYVMKVDGNFSETKKQIVIP